MLPNLAIFLCVFFILIVFIIDSKQKSDVSFALWVPLIWYLLVASRNVSRWLNPEGFDLTGVSYLSGSPIDRIVYSTLIVIGVFILLSRRLNWSQILKSNAWIFILFLYMGFSILWSDFQEVSFKRWIRTIGVLVMVLVVLTETNPLETISRLLRRCFYVHLPLSIILIKYFRTVGIAWDYLGNEMWIGVTGHKNNLGEVAMISGNYFLWTIMREWGSKKVFIYILYLFMAFWLLNGSGDSRSNTAIFVFSVGIIILLGLHLIRSNIEYIRKYMAIAIFLIAFLYISSQLAIEAFTQKSLLSVTIGASGRDMTLTGRTDLWTDLLNIASHHPILGVGYGSFWIGDLANNLWEKHIWQPGQGHNGYIDVYVELGLVGIFLLIMAIFSAYKNIIRTFAFNFEYGRFKMVLLSMILLHNITESSFTRGTHHLWFLFLIVAVNIPEISQSHLNIPSKGKLYGS